MCAQQCPNGDGIAHVARLDLLEDALPLRCAECRVPVVTHDDVDATAALPADMVLFTAHSLPEKILESGDPYDREARATARLVAEKAGLEAWDFAYQSQGMSGGKWLGPTVESCLDDYAGRGVREVNLVPIGFVSVSPPGPAMPLMAMQ